MSQNAFRFWAYPFCSSRSEHLVKTLGQQEAGIAGAKGGPSSAPGYQLHLLRQTLQPRPATTGLGGDREPALPSSSAPQPHIQRDNRDILHFSLRHGIPEKLKMNEFDFE